MVTFAKIVILLLLGYFVFSVAVGIVKDYKNRKAEKKQELDNLEKTVSDAEKDSANDKSE